MQKAPLASAGYWIAYALRMMQSHSPGRRQDDGICPGVPLCRSPARQVARADCIMASMGGAGIACGSQGAGFRFVSASEATMSPTLPDDVRHLVERDRLRLLYAQASGSIVISAAAAIGLVLAFG